MEVERSINELYEGYEPRWDMADWKNGTEELALEAKRIAQSDHINDTHVFSDFSKIVAQNIANKYNLKAMRDHGDLLINRSPEPHDQAFFEIISDIV